jgi:hypothetical protein
MAARRLLIVLLVLLGISTLAAALVPQHSLRRERTARTPTRPAATPPPTAAVPGRTLAAKVVVGRHQVPVVAGPVCRKGEAKCDQPIHVGDQLVLLVYAKPAAQLAVPSFGEVGFASPNAPASFELLLRAPGTIGVVFAGSDRVAAKVVVLTHGQAKMQMGQLKKGKKR